MAAYMCSSTNGSSSAMQGGVDHGAWPSRHPTFLASSYRHSLRYPINKRMELVLLWASNDKYKFNRVILLTTLQAAIRCVLPIAIVFFLFANSPMTNHEFLNNVIVRFHLSDLR